MGVICYWCESAACCTSHLTFKNTVLLAKPPNGWWFSRVLHHLLSTLSISCFFFPCWWIAVESFHWQNVASKSSLAKIEPFFASIPVVLCGFEFSVVFICVQKRCNTSLLKPCKQTQSYGEQPKRFRFWNDLLGRIVSRLIHPNYKWTLPLVALFILWIPMENHRL